MATGRVPTTANSPLTAKGDLFGYSTTQARVPVGSDGETLVADSSASTGLRWQSVAQLNPVINSNFSIWQRGTSTTDVNGPSRFGADRWQVFSGTSGRTISRQLTNDTTNLPNIQYCIRLARDSGNTATEFIAMGQNFETATSYPFAGKTVTYSFWARKGANFSGTFNSKLTTGTGTDENGFYNGYTGASTIADYSPTLTTTWQRFSTTASIASNATEIVTSFSTSAFSGTAGAADFVEITGVQLEIGSVATAYRPLASTLAGELAACQRYYYRQSSNSSNAYAGFAFGTATATTTVDIPYKLAQTMRIAPTLTDFANLAVSADNATLIAVTNLAIVSTENSADSPIVRATVTGATQFRPYGLFANNNTNAYVGFSAEL